MSHSNRASRRDFLRGRAASEKPPQPDGPSAGRSDPSSREATGGYLQQYTKTAMACQFELLFNMHQYPGAAQAAMDAFGLIDRLEDQLTVYRDHSEVSRLNRAAASKSVRAENHLFELLELSVQLYQQTGGAFDITAAQLTKLWGFDQRAGRVPDPQQIEKILTESGSDAIRLDASQQTVQFQHDRLNINLGGIGKGHSLDRVSDLMRDHSIDDFIIHGGQSSVLARGENLETDESDSQKSSEPNASNEAKQSDEREGGRGWVVGLSHPTIPGLRLAEFNLRNQALGTSGTGRQGFFHQGKRYGHIIDPRTGWPTDHVLSSTVISPSAAISDALATAFFVMSLDDVADYCQKHPEVSALLVLPESKARGQIAMEWFNLGDDQWQRLV